MTGSDDTVTEATRAGILARRAHATATRRPRLLIIGPLPPPFIGPAVATRRLLDSPVLAEHFDIDFLDTSDPEGFDDIGRLGWHNISMALRHGARCVGMLVRRRPAAIYVPIARGLWGFVRDLLFIVPARMLGARVVVHLRAGRFDLIHDNGRLGRAIARAGLSLVDRALVLGRSVRDVYGSSIAPERVGIVPNGMRLEGWEADAWSAARIAHDPAGSTREGAARDPAGSTREGVAHDPAGSTREAAAHVRVAYIANLFHDKGIHVMLAAMALLKRNTPAVTVTFAGDWGNATYREQCMALMRELAIEDRVRFVGRVDDAGKRRMLAESDLAVFVPVKPEGLPWVVIEAMAAALPVIGTPQGTMAELIVDGETGFIVPVDDAAALAARIAELAADPARRVAMGCNGRARVEEFYAEDRTHERLAQEILGCIQ